MYIRTTYDLHNVPWRLPVGGVRRHGTRVHVGPGTKFWKLLPLLGIPHYPTPQTAHVLNTIYRFARTHASVWSTKHSDQRYTHIDRCCTYVDGGVFVSRTAKIFRTQLQATKLGLQWEISQWRPWALSGTSIGTNVGYETSNLLGFLDSRKSAFRAEKPPSRFRAVSKQADSTSGFSFSFFFFFFYRCFQILGCAKYGLYFIDAAMLIHFVSAVGAFFQAKHMFEDNSKDQLRFAITFCLGSAVGTCVKLTRALSQRINIFPSWNTQFAFFLFLTFFLSTSTSFSVSNLVFIYN
jgi:hypothetical protein